MRVTDEEFIQAWRKYGSPSLMSKHLGIGQRAVQDRRRAVEVRHGVTLDTWNDLSNRGARYSGWHDMSVQNGTVIVFSDAHFLPGVRTTAQRALIALIKQLRPVAIICNGDAFDGGAISRYPRIGWDNKPTVKQEIEAVESALTEIEDVARGAALIWPVGNHDERFETRLAAVAPEFEGLSGFRLKDYFKKWLPCWACWINEDVCVTHFYHQGIHATHNNILKGQCHYVTGHTHSLKVTPWTNAKGDTIYGVDTGTLADALAGHNLDYQRGRHGNHRSGFAVLTFRDGVLLMPELVQVWDHDRVQFRGHLLDADTGRVV